MERSASSAVTAAEELAGAPPPEAPKGGRARAAARIALGTAAFVSAAALGVVAHLGLAAPRRLAAQIISDVLTRELSGKFVIERIDRMGLDGFDGAVVEVQDERGEVVIRARGLRARSSIPDLLATVLHRSAPLDLLVRRVRCDHADVVIEPDPSGTPTIVRAFSPRVAGNGGPGRPFRVWLPRVKIASANVRARIDAGISAELEVGDLTGSVLAASDQIVVDANRFGLNLRGAGLERAQGTAEVHLRHRSEGELAGWSYRGSFEGFAGDVQTQLGASYAAGRIRLDADIPGAKPENLRALVRGLPVFDTVRMHLSAEGALPVLHARADVSVGSGAFDLEGDVRIADALSTDFYFDARTVPVRAFAPQLPGAVVSASGHVVASRGANGVLQGSFEMATDPIAWGDVPPFPSASASGRFGTAFVDGDAVLYEPGAPTKVHVELRAPSEDPKPDPNREPEGPIIRFEASTKIPSLQRAPRLASFGRGAASATARGSYAAGVLSAVADLKLDGPRSGEASARAAAAHVELEGRPDRLSVRANATLEEPRFGTLSFSEGRVQASGPIGAPDVQLSLRGGEDLPDIEGRAKIGFLGERPTIDGLEVALSRGKLHLTARARSVRWESSGIDIADASIEGAGAPLSGSLSLGPDSLAVSMHSSGLDLDALSQAAGLPEGLVRGRATVDAEIEARGGHEKGHARFWIENGVLATLDGVEAHGEADLDGHALTLGAEVRAGKVGSVLVTAMPVTLAGSALSLRSWREATGVALIDANTNLNALNVVVPGYVLPFDDVKGTLSVKGSVSRDRPSAWPDVNAVLWTAGLATGPVRSWNSDDAHPESRGLSLTKIDVQAGVNFAGATGHTESTVRLVDDEGIFVSASAAADLPMKDLTTPGSRRSALLMSLPVTGRVLVPKRRLDAFPPWFRPTGLLGEVELTADFTGSAKKPSVRAHASGQALRGETVAVAVPVDATVDALYDGAAVDVRAEVQRQTQKLLNAAGRVVLPWDKVLAANEHSPVDWNAEGFAELSDFPLEAIPALADRAISGRIGGEVALSGLHQDPHLSVRAHLDGLKVGEAAFSGAQALGSLEGGRGSASIRLDQADGGYLSATGSAKVAWGADLLPSVSTNAPADVYVSAEKLRAAVFHPLLAGLFTHVDGQIDAKLHMRQAETDGHLDQSVEGEAELRNGVMQIPEVGQELHAASAKVSLDSTGAIKLESLSARGLSGRLQANGEAMLDGFSLHSGDFNVSIAEKDAIPLTLEGVSLGDAWGRLSIALRHQRGDSKVRLDVQIPELHADIPESSTRDVQSLADNSSIRIGRRLSDGSLEAIALGPPEESRSGGALSWQVAFHLGDAVTVKQGASVQLSVRGDPVVTLTDRARVSGQIELGSGVIDLLGKRFQIEHGTAAFDEDSEPGNPFLTVRARWDAPDATRVYADYVGPLKTGTLSFSAEPARTRSEILALILFGSESDASGSGAVDPSSSMYAAGGVGGGALTMGINRVLSGVAHGEISTRVDTTVAQNPRPEVAVRISSDVSAQVGYVTGVVAPGQNPDRMLLKIDWRFLRNWSLATTFGNSGSSILDFVWQYRY